MGRRRAAIVRTGAVASILLFGGIVCGTSAFGREVDAPGLASESAAPPYQSPVPTESPAAQGDVSKFDGGQETPAPPATPAQGPDPYPDGPRSSRFLLEEAFGLRPSWEERGVSFYASSTLFEQGVTAGGARQAFRWGGKFDMLAHLDGGKLGLWEGGTFDLFAESRLGQSIDGFAGAYAPTNLAMFFPVPDAQVTAITGLKFTQEITEHFGLFFGKLNALNGDRDRFLKYPLTSRFWNAAFNFNLALDRYPYSTPGAGFYAIPERGPALSFLVLDSHNSPRTSGFENLGRNGVFLYAEAAQATSFFGRPGKHKFAGLYGSGSFTDLAPAPFLQLPADPSPAPEKTGTWTLLWHVEQRLLVNPDAPDRGLGLYVQAGLGDGNPNPIRSFVSVALCGNSPFLSREGDLWGLGFYNIGLGAAAKNHFPGLRDERGVELFYNLRLAPGCHLTPDLQLLHPGVGPLDAALMFGVRMKLDF